MHSYSSLFVYALDMSSSCCVVSLVIRDLQINYGWLEANGPFWRSRILRSRNRHSWVNNSGEQKPQQMYSLCSHLPSGQISITFQKKVKKKNNHEIDYICLRKKVVKFAVPLSSSYWKLTQQHYLVLCHLMPSYENTKYSVINVHIYNTIKKVYNVHNCVNNC